MKVLVVVDMQNDFIEGPLGSSEAVVARDNLRDWVKDHITKNDKVIFTQDTHYNNYLTTQEGKNLPITHCIFESMGWMIDERTLKTIYGITSHISFVEKKTFGATNLDRYIPVFHDKVDEIIFCGVCTDICVISNALIMKAQFPETPISVIANCCAGTTPENHKAALQVMKSCQINVEGE